MKNWESYMIDQLILNYQPEMPFEENEDEEENEQIQELKEVPKTKLINIYQKNLRDKDYA